MILVVPAVPRIERWCDTRRFAPKILVVPAVPRHLFWTETFRARRRCRSSRWKLEDLFFWVLRNSKHVEARDLFWVLGNSLRVLGNSRAKKKGFWEIQNNSQNPEPKKSRTQKMALNIGCRRMNYIHQVQSLEWEDLQDLAKLYIKEGTIHPDAFSDWFMEWKKTFDPEIVRSLTRGATYTPEIFIRWK